jgi:hypothetical protein
MDINKYVTGKQRNLNHLAAIAPAVYLIEQRQI